MIPEAGKLGMLKGDASLMILEYRATWRLPKSERQVSQPEKAPKSPRQLITKAKVVSSKNSILAR